MATATPAHRVHAGSRVFTRVLVGIDGSEQSLEAARQAALLQVPQGLLTLVRAWEVAPPIAGGPTVGESYELEEKLLREQAERELRTACDYVAPYTPAVAKLVRGTPVVQLLEEIEREQDTLVVIGTTGGGRLLGIVEGSVGTSIIHRSPCSVLVARRAKDGFPRRVVVGVDGSVESAAAYAAARYLVERFDAELHTVVAWGGRGVNERLAFAITEGDHEDASAPPAEALTRCAEEADLVVLGSRGLHGLHAIGSVSEHVAHSAPASVLVIREPSWQRVAAELGR